MGLLEDLNQIGSYRAGGTCNVAKVFVTLQKQDPELAAAFAVKIRDRSVNVPALLVVMRRHGHDITRSTVTRHRRGECRCVQDLGI